MMKAILLVVASLLALNVTNTVAARILALCAVASHSHSLWCYHYMATLAERGHQITVLGVDKPKIKIPNLTTYIASGVYESFAENMDTSDWTIEDKSKLSVFYPGFTMWNEMGTKGIMYSEALQDLIKDNKNVNRPFDLIIHDNGNADALLGLVPIFGNPPLLLATTYGSPQWMNFRAGNIFNPAYVPSMITGNDQKMNFYERCINTFYYAFIELVCLWVMEPFQDKIMREVLGQDLPYVKNIAKQANVIIVNHHFAINGPLPLLPGVVGISGLHISEPKPLPQDIKEFMDGAKDGVILLSFGTNIDSTWFSPDFEHTILKALKELPQRVLWKWDRNLTNIPSNVKVSKWLPQGDMLVHPKMRLFVSHCGLLSTQEAIYHKVPLLALPVFLDQVDNAAMMVRHNLTIKLNVFNLTTNQLRDGIREILNNPMYKKNMEKMGELMTDLPMTAKQSAVYWTEYAIRHKGAAHLHSASADMPWYQLLLLDVIGLALVVTLAALWLLKTILTCVVQKLFTKSKNKRD